jgi:phosphate-selective porin
MRKLAALVALLMMAAVSVRAADTVTDLKKDVEDLRKRITARTSAESAATSKVDSALASKYGPGAGVTTKAGKLEIGGLLQIWNYNIQNDTNDVFGDTGAHAGSGGTSEAVDNNGYRIRRSELRFSIDIHENIQAVVMIDPAREATSFAPLPSNQGLFKSFRENPSIATGFPIANTSVGRVQAGTGQANRMLQDAYINYHGVVPHHDFTVGQFKPKIGEEGVRSSAFLDFAERAMVTQDNDLRDLGAEVHGSWWGEGKDGRFQYWLGAFNGAGNFFGTASPATSALGEGQFQNRSDDNNSKDFAGRFMVRPLWNHGPWGSMELGYSGQWGTHGESGDLSTDGSTPVNGLNRLSTAASRQAAWIYYKPMGPVRGLWLRSEWGYQKDRTAPFTVNALGLGSGPLGEQAAANPFSRQGYFGSIGYKLSDSVFADRLNSGGFFNNLMQPVEFAFRYERFGNIISEDLVQPDQHTDVFNTDVFTAGVNYYVKAYNMRVQVNYMLVNEQENKVNQANRDFHEVKNNVFIFTYQVAF